MLHFLKEHKVMEGITELYLFEEMHFRCSPKNIKRQKIGPNRSLKSSEFFWLHRIVSTLWMQIAAEQGRWTPIKPSGTLRPPLSTCNFVSRPDNSACLQKLSVYTEPLHSRPSNERGNWIRRESIGPRYFLACSRPSQPPLASLTR